MTAAAAGPEEVAVYVVLPPRVLLLDVAGPIEVLRKANLEQDRLRFVVHYVGPAATVSSSIGLEVAGVAPLPDTLPEGALVVIAGSAAVTLGAVPANQADDAAKDAAIVDWLAQRVRPGIGLISICSGALLAARAGLLDGVACTTHHACCAELARLAPKARVVENRLYVEDGERLSSAGVTAGIDLMLHLVARRIGPACALAVARYLVLYLRRGPGDPQLSPWLEGRNHLHRAIHRAQDAVAADPARPWSLGDLAEVAAISPRSLSRLFNDQVGMSVTDYVNRLRIALAHDILTATRLDMEAVAERAGFSSTRQFRRAWSRLHALPPSRTRPVGKVEQG
ncbi:GlxA family transcriptional regulator [Rhodospirillum rubrum]|uniref:Transcriptional regulator, AraC family with amidase-like domain n=1 Tax=Rhodospirillum rubrum (strain ATCC 11170 / ATH 1.1.1 / DSM 467 / LMG 4362 / NCIMB 8255 / S1) TaxID=269796 RepID=Q2RWD3_RHORT|nr:helix-turn-helix domain-containing protein [Rhodospirillum rubrum]ABC21562.1 transcriptional regulator, AraC family with amidase-like domain [Rhodospirillum rubrum ATCC 11170]AEO47247.1 transcriptional regulator [Rhodospirillum rubrum F11]MBK5953181.1 transcriptional regulator [Rhodospirillum rubrum]QXG81231.1 helix-turn-helix domain-containing protein [Rhodospirillum rubrum]HCF19201.1 transcriptional regulator [Rhodospirillum rubrum]